LKVAADEKAVYFYARTAQPITPHTDPHWMMLFIDADNKPRTGWEGFNFRVNGSVPSETTSTLEKPLKDGTWTGLGPVAQRVRGNELELAVPRSMLGLAADRPTRISFKWADNTQKDNDVMEFTINGDAAP